MLLTRLEEFNTVEELEAYLEFYDYQERIVNEDNFSSDYFNLQVEEI